MKAETRKKIKANWQLFKESLPIFLPSQVLLLLAAVNLYVPMRRTMHGVLLILLGIASNALSALVGGSHVKEFFSGVLMGMSVAEMLAGVVIVAIHVIHGKCEE